MPTPQQQRAAKNISEIIRKGKSTHNTKGKAIKDAGYSEQTSKKPKLVTESKGFKEAMKELGTVEWINSHLKKLEKLMEEKADEAEYSSLSQSYDRMIKNKELLEGRETERGGVNIKIVSYSDESAKK